MNLKKLLISSLLALLPMGYMWLIIIMDDLLNIMIFPLPNWLMNVLYIVAVMNFFVLIAIVNIILLIKWFFIEKSFHWLPMVLMISNFLSLILTAFTIFFFLVNRV